MLKFVKLNKVKGHREGYYDNDRVVQFAEPNAVEETTPVVINPTVIKSYYPRKGGRVGTRINFTLGSGMAVKETPAEFEALIGQCGEDVAIVGTHASTGVVESEAQN